MSDTLSRNQWLSMMKHRPPDPNAGCIPNYVNRFVQHKNEWEEKLSVGQRHIPARHVDTADGHKVGDTVTLPDCDRFGKVKRQVTGRITSIRRIRTGGKVDIIVGLAITSEKGAIVTLYNQAC